MLSVVKSQSSVNSSCVAVVEASYRTAQEQIREALRLLDYRPQRKRILLKPNLVTYPRWLPLGKTPRSTITDPRFLDALLRVFAGCEITIADSAIAGHNTDEVFRRTGMTRLAEKHGARLVNLDRCQRFDVPWKHGTLRLPELLRTHEYINVPKLKTHLAAGVTIACKNQKGLLTSKEKIRFHKELDLSGAIRDLADTVQPALTIVDGIVGMDRGGPTFGRSRRSGLIVAGRDLRAVDVACCDLISVPVERVGHLDRVGYHTAGRTVAEMRQRFEVADTLVIANTHIHFTPATCSRCLQSAHDGLAATLPSPYDLLRAFRSCILRRTDVITGQSERIPNSACGRLVCYGKCTRELAEKHNLQWIPGCPPSVKDYMKVY